MLHVCTALSLTHGRSRSGGYSPLISGDYRSDVSRGLPMMGLQMRVLSANKESEWIGSVSPNIKN